MLFPVLPSPQFAASDLRFGATNARKHSLNYLVPYESFIDTILGGCLRLKGFLRTEQHYEVYDAESLHDETQKYEVRAYDLRELPPKVRNYRIKNLKRASARSSCVGSLKQGGKKWLVFADVPADLVQQPFRNCGPTWCTKEEYARAFPVTEPSRPYDPKKTEKKALQDGAVVEAYDPSIEKALEEELSQRLDARQTLVDRVPERLVALSKPCHEDNEMIHLSEKQKKLKSPEQAKRLRDRQRLSRQERRKAKAVLKMGETINTIPQTLDMTSGPPIEIESAEQKKRPRDRQQLSRQERRKAKAALKMGETSNSIPQTLDMTSGPPTKTSSENEHDHVAADKSIAIQVQEDLERRFLCDICRIAMRAWEGTFMFEELDGRRACLRALGGEDPESLLCDPCRVTMRAWGALFMFEELGGRHACWIDQE